MRLRLTKEERAVRAILRWLAGRIKFKSAAKLFNGIGVLKMGNTKLGKGSAVIAGITLAPADKAGLIGRSGLPLSVCPFAIAAGCKPGCLDDEGRQGSPLNVSKREQRTIRWWRHREAFLADFESGLEVLAEVKARGGPDLTVGFRGNVLSDIRWELHTLPRSGLTPVEFAVQAGLKMYDYTKWPLDKRPDVPGYKLTRSYSRFLGEAGAVEVLEQGGNVAVIFDVRKKADLPATWLGFPVLDGDKDDERWNAPPGTVVGLRLKGSHKVKDGLRRIGMVGPVAAPIAIAA